MRTFIITILLFNIALTFGNEFPWIDNLLRETESLFRVTKESTALWNKVSSQWKEYKDNEEYEQSGNPVVINAAYYEQRITNLQGALFLQQHIRNDPSEENRIQRKLDRDRELHAMSVKQGQMLLPVLQDIKNMLDYALNGDTIKLEEEKAKKLKGYQERIDKKISLITKIPNGISTEAKKQDSAKDKTRKRKQRGETVPSTPDKKPHAEEIDPRKEHETDGPDKAKSVQTTDTNLDAAHAGSGPHPNGSHKDEQQRQQQKTERNADAAYTDNNGKSAATSSPGNDNENHDQSGFGKVSIIFGLILQCIIFIQY